MLKINELTHKQWLRIALLTLCLFVVFQITAMLGQLSSSLLTRHHALDSLERRLSLDIAYLDVGNQTLNTPVNVSAVKRYIARLNEQLDSQHYPVRITSIQDVTVVPAEPLYSDPQQMNLVNAEQNIKIGLTQIPLNRQLKLSPVAILAALILAPLLIQVKRVQQQQKRKIAKDALPPEPKLVINMIDKSIGNGVDSKLVFMQNKPFCFYAALVKFCIDNPNQPLVHHQDIPADLVRLANKVFARLIELGHTKRKRPDFNANLDKTLSEIRAGLDDVFADFNQQKERYYPPRAQGEGSRSKQHSFALPVLSKEDVEFIGL